MFMCIFIQSFCEQRTVEIASIWQLEHKIKHFISFSIGRGSATMKDKER